MLEVTAAAVKNVKDYLSQNKIESAVRVSLMSGGCSGPSLSLSLDETQKAGLTDMANNFKALDLDKDGFLSKAELKANR